MNIKEAKRELKNTVAAYLEKDDLGEYIIPALRQRPVLLMGPPGIGKTQIMEQVARECGIAFVSYTITHHTRQSAVGLPFIEKTVYGDREYSVTRYTMSEIIASIYDRQQETGLCEGILFIDEINCVSETLAPTMLQFLQCKTFGNQKVPEGWIIVAAGNPPEYNKSVREFDVVTLDRVRRMDITADYQVWKEYARNAGVDRAVLSYLDLHPKNFYRMEADVDGMQFVTARGWEDFGKLLESYRRKKLPVTTEVAYEFLRHQEVAEDVAAYLELYEKYQDDYGMEDILEGKVSTEIYRRIYQAAFDERLTVIQLLIEKLMLFVGQYSRKKRMTDAWYVFLKEYRSLVEQEDVRTAYENLVQETREKISQKKTAGLISAVEEKEQSLLLDKIEEYVPKIGQVPKEAFQEAKSGFDLFRERMEMLRAQVGQKMEFAFDFMEEAFQGGEEMVLFVTELTLSPEAALFLADYHCERYLEYSQKLLVGSRRRELLQEMEDHE